MVPTPIRTSILETAVVVAATRWHVTHSPQPAPPLTESQRDNQAEQASRRLHEAVTALQAEYDRHYPTATTEKASA